MNSRKRLLEDLLRAEKPVVEILDQLQSFGWDSEAELVEVDRRTVSSILERFVAGNLNANDVVAWANAIEGRDDVGVAEYAPELVKKCIFELANPVLSGPLTITRAKELIARLASS